MASSLRVVFAGTPAFAAESLRALLQGHHEVIAVYTQPDRPAGRGRQTRPSAVKTLALAHDIPVYQPVTLRDGDAQAELAALAPDVMVVAAYGLLLPPDVLSIPRWGCINVHASLLPRWRGAAPVQRAILAGDRETGITLMQMDAGLDTGDILHTVTCPISVHDTGASLTERLALLGGDALLTVMDHLRDGLPIVATPQDAAHATYAHKLSKEEARLDWSQHARVLSRRIRAFNDVPIAYTVLAGEVVRIWQAHRDKEVVVSAAPGTLLQANRQGIQVAAGEGSVLVIDRLQLAGGKPLTANELFNAPRAAWQPGQRFET